MPSFFKLPILPMNQMIKSMDTLEQVALALCSKKMEQNVKRAKIELSWCEVNVRDELSNIDINCGEAILCCGTGEIESDLKLNNKEMSNWLNPDLPMIENTVNVFKRVKNIFRCEHFELNLDMENMKKTSVREVFSIPELQNHTKLSVLMGEIESDDLKYIMEAEKPEVHISIEVTVPIDFRSENAFKFKAINYADARWVRVEDLFSLRNSTHVTLEDNNLRAFDINTLLKFWVNNDHDMFKMLTIGVYEEENFMDLFRELVVLRTTRFELPVYYLTAKDIESRRKSVLEVYCDETGLVMHEWEKDRELEGDGDKSTITYKKEYEILRILERKEELRKEGMEANDRQQEIRAEVEELNGKLDEYEVYYDNFGVPTID